MRGMTSEGIYESISRSWKYSRQLKQLRRICSNGARSQRSFYYLHKKVQVKNKTKSERQQLLEDLTGRFEESERRTESDTQKRQSDIENEKKKAQEIRKKQRLGET